MGLVNHPVTTTRVDSSFRSPAVESPPAPDQYDQTKSALRIAAPVRRAPQPTPPATLQGGLSAYQCLKHLPIPAALPDETKHHGSCRHPLVLLREPRCDLGHRVLNPSLLSSAMSRRPEPCARIIRPACHGCHLGAGVAEWSLRCLSRRSRQ